MKKFVACALLGLAVLCAANAFAEEVKKEVTSKPTTTSAPTTVKVAK